jgi:DNA invertase Pin-like site-specific DNA recombinase
MRYSSDNQRQDSIVDQRRNIVQHLDRLGIGYEGAIELADEAITGTSTRRPGFQKLNEMIDNDQVSLVVVDDLSRLTRRNDLGILWDKMAFHGCRLISVLDGVDSIREGDEMSALIKGVMNNVTNKLHGKRVRRGIAGRALEKFGSAGNRPFGYGSRYSDPDAALNYSGSGQRPKKVVFIDEEEARIVREIYHLFVDEGWSLAKIKRHLNKNNATTGKRARIRTEFGPRPNPIWNKTRVRRVLQQVKYIGIWRYGENICKKTERGTLVMRPADPQDVIEVNNPDLAIISREMWDKAQARLAAFKEEKGYWPGQKRRGPKRHYTADYPNGTCGGIVYCGECGKKMYRVPKFTKNNKEYGPYYRCINAVDNGLGERGCQCGHKSFVREERIFDALAGYVDKHLRNCDGWLGEAFHELRKAYASHYASVPDELRQLRARQKEVALFIGNITGEIERGGGKEIPGALLDRLKALETEARNIDARIRRLEIVEEKEASLPSDEWFKAQLADMADVLAESPEKAGKLFRQLFDKVYVRTILSPGKARGHSVISFTPNNNALVIQVANLGETLGLESLDLREQSSEMVSIDLPGYDKYDKIMPAIDSMRREGRTWTYICRELGVTEEWARKCHKNWKKLDTTVPAPSPLLLHDALEDSASSTAN